MYFDNSKAGWKLEDLEQQRRPLLGDEDCRRWKPGCSCYSSDHEDDEDEDEEEEDDDDDDYHDNHQDSNKDKVTRLL